MAGNVVTYLADGTSPWLERLSAHLAPGGYLVSGFGLAGSVPPGAAGRPEDVRPARRGGRAVVHRPLRHVGQGDLRGRQHVRRVGAPPAHG